MWHSKNNLTKNYEVEGLILGLAQWVKIPICWELWCGSQTCLRSGVAVAVAWDDGFNSSSTPSLRISMCHRCGPKKREKKKRDGYHQGDITGNSPLKMTCFKILSPSLT